MSRHRKISRALQNRHANKRGPNGKRLCTWCGVEVKPPRRTFCSDDCVHEYKIRSDPGYVRIQLRNRDHGICAQCGLDCEKLQRVLNYIQYGTERPYARPRYDPYYASQAGGLDIVKQTLVELGFLAYPIRSLWDADHILEVVNGGGECGLENYQTLCQVCHKAKTKKLAADRAKARKAEKAKKDPQ